ncbi:MAG: glutamate 5-kinase [Candidatus Omnitrophica bacterium CG1_02_49_10]|nr:MAG: glutamate 5-kinase [Candidatus Omnitrophica bacterium CG1_02_49_10]
MFRHSYRRIVVKLGSRVLTGGRSALDESLIDGISAEVCALIDKGIKVCIVSSGAIAAGMHALGFKKRPASLPHLQASAAIGQSQLMKLYEKSFAKRGRLVAQVLLTREDLEIRSRYLNARNTIFTLIDAHITPIINENDTVSVEEIKFGDNDILSCQISNLINADLLLLLTDVEGLFKGRPGSSAELIRKVDKITHDIECAVSDTCTGGISSGGMASKLKAAKIATSCGTAVVIANGREKRVIGRIVGGEDIGTSFVRAENKIACKKQWIAFSGRAKGKVVIDKGAEEALVSNHKSLLAKGIVSARGKFDAADVVDILNKDDKPLARGISNYSSDEIERIKGHASNKIESVLGYKYYDEVIHRDNLVIMGS